MGLAYEFFQHGLNRVLGRWHQENGTAPFRFRLLGLYWTVVFNLEDIREIFSAPDSALDSLQPYADLVGHMMPKAVAVNKRRDHFFADAFHASMFDTYLATMVDETLRQVSMPACIGGFCHEHCR